ncbi:hypothetical protein FRC14_007704 [Serendipita sp. 396]|nr:hypothetical protein FRC14_007704 [Serendipita sp. 396]
MSNPEEMFLSVDISQNSRLADVSENETAEVLSPITRTQTRTRSRRKKRAVTALSSRVMSRGEDEFVPDWTVGMELFEGHQAPLIARNSRKNRETDNSVPRSTGEGSGLARNATSVINHWKKVITTSRINRENIDEERGETSVPDQSPSAPPTRPVEIQSRSQTIRAPTSSSPPAFTMSPQTHDPLDSVLFPARHALDGAEDVLDHHRLSTEYERTDQTLRNRNRPSNRSRSSSSASSQTSSDQSHVEAPVQSRVQSKFKKFAYTWKDQVPTFSTLQRNLFKCAIAYFIASLFTFIPTLSNLLSYISTFGRQRNLPSPSAHMVATVVVYYNPAKTTGGMFEADVFCLMGVFFALFITCASILSSWIIDNHPLLEWLGDLTILTWIGIAITVISWMKVWINKASFNTASSMTCIIMFIVVVKEGGFATLFSVFVNVLVGVIIANVICFILWPQSATTNLQRDMITSLESYATLLDMLTSSFLLDPRSKGRAQLIRAVEAHQAGFTSLKRNLDEARSEWVPNPPDPPTGKRGLKYEGFSELYGEAVDSLNRLAQHLAGLRTGTRLQRELTLAYGRKRIHQKLKKEASKRSGDATGASEDDPIFTNLRDGDEEAAALAAATAVFGSIVDDVGPPMVALTEACTETLKSMRSALIQDRQRSRHTLSWFGRARSQDRHDFSLLSAGIEKALFLFDSTSNQALMRLYRRSANTKETDSLSSTTDHLHDENETMFLVYFFIFTLQEFARELVSLVDVMGRLHEAQENALDYRGFIGWLRRLLNLRGISSRLISHLHEAAPNYGSITTGTRKKLVAKPGLRKRFTNLVPVEPSRVPHRAFPRTRAHAPNTTHTPARSSLPAFGRVKHRLWSFLNKLKDGDMRYSFKVGVSTAILAAPAFIDITRPIFVEWRGEWALISFFVVMGQTIGATNFLALHRIMGTLFGASVAVIAFGCLSHYPILLAIFGFFFSLPCFYYIVSKPEYATTGRFVLLSYNLTALYCYNSRDSHLSVYDVAVRRSIAVTAGVIWALVVSRTWWPSEARRELGVGLSDMLLNLGWIYNRLVLTYSVPPEMLAQAAAAESGVALPVLGATAAIIDEMMGGPDERTGLLGAALVTGLNASIRDFMAMELHLQIKLISLQKLLSQAQHEPRLKGPFPVPLYRSILTSLQIILDLFHSMRCVTTREEWYTAIRRDFVIPVNKERREMVGNVILFFSVLSSAFQLKKPLPPYLPPAEKSRQRLVAALKDLTIVKERRVQSSRQLLYFAYALMMRGVIAELETLGRTVQEAFGVIGGKVGDFESLFIADNNEIRHETSS